MQYQLKKEEKLKRKKLIEKLFTEGNTIKLFPLKLVFVPIALSQSENIQVGFSVSKKKIKLAVHRNRIKRLMREAYRLNKPPSFNESENSYALMFLYLGQRNPDFKQLQKTMKEILGRFIKQ